MRNSEPLTQPTEATQLSLRTSGVSQHVPYSPLLLATAKPLV